MLENVLENKFVDYVKDIGGRAVKGPAFQYKGIPDRIAILPNGGGTVWVEFKNGEYQLQPLQQWWKSLLVNSDPNRYFVVDSYEALDKCIQACNNLINKVV